jgi:hypothetical protein
MASRPLRFHPQAEHQYFTALAWRPGRSLIAATNYERIQFRSGENPGSCRALGDLFRGFQRVPSSNFPSVLFSKFSLRKFWSLRLLMVRGVQAIGWIGRETQPAGPTLPTLRSQKGYATLYQLGFAAPRITRRGTSSSLRSAADSFRSASAPVEVTKSPLSASGQMNRPRSRHYPMCMPPFTLSMWPVMYPA